MAIYQRDRNFRSIIDEIEVETIPLKFVRDITCYLHDGSKIILEQSDFEKVNNTDNLENLIKDLDFFEMLSDLKIRIDFGKVEEDVSDQVTNILRKVDNDQSNTSM